MADEKPVDGVSDYDFGQHLLHYWSRIVALADIPVM